MIIIYIIIINCYIGLRLAELLGCPSPLEPSSLVERSPSRHGHSVRAKTASVVSTYANIYGTRALYALLDAHGWRIDRPCIQICTPLAGPLKFTREAIDDCVRRCGARATVDHSIATRIANIPPRGITSWCHVDGRSARHVDGDGYDLLTRMLELDPRRRIDATSALNHPYLTRARAAASHVLPSVGHASPRSAARPATLSAHTVTLQSKSAASRVRALRTNTPASATHPPGVHVAPGASPGVHVAPYAPADTSVARVHVGYVLLGNPFSHGTTGRVQVHLPN